MTNTATDFVLKGRRCVLFKIEDCKTLVAVICVAPPLIPKIIGTAFLTSFPDTNNRIFAITAAHVLSEIRHLLSPPKRSALSTLTEFLPTPKKIIFDTQRVIVNGFENGKSIAGTVTGAIFNEELDIGMLSISPNKLSEKNDPYFSATMPLTTRVPSVGDLVMIYGLHNQSIDVDRTQETSTDGKTRILQNRVPLLIAGKVLSYYANGRGLCKGPCIETSIPVTPGMSGSPAILYKDSGEMECFGVVSASSESEDSSNEDNYPPGNSIVSLLAPHLTNASRFGATIDLFVPFSNWSDSFNPPKNEHL